MIRHYGMVGMLMIATFLLRAEVPSYSEHIAAILFNHCATCHRPGGIGHFSLLSYSDAVIWSAGIRNAVSQRLMPPWPPDPGYGEFCHERRLSEEEVEKIISWIDNGMPEGDPIHKPPVPEFRPGRIIQQSPDLVIRMPVYASQANLSDEYKCFVIPTHLPKDRYIRAIEVVPGNLAIVHHVIAVADETGSTNCNQAISTGKTLVGYAPGSMPLVFPDHENMRLGILLKAGSNILLQMHYPKGSAGQIDSTAVHFYFYPENTPHIREIVAGPYLVNLLINIPANTTRRYTAYYPYNGYTTEDISLVAVFPHMHKVGRSMRSFAVTSSNDTIHLFNISNWRFDWQGYYNYKRLVKIPAGSRIYGEAFYDNTVNNPYNPNNPPQDVTLGEQTNDEMFLISFQSVPYVEGDENYDIESMLHFTGISSANRSVYPSWTLRPNPTNGEVRITGWNYMSGESSRVIVIDLLGRPQIIREVTAASDALTLQLGDLNEGIYHVLLENNQRREIRRLVIIR